MTDIDRHVVELSEMAHRIAEAAREAQREIVAAIEIIRGLQRELAPSSLPAQSDLGDACRCDHCRTNDATKPAPGHAPMAPPPRGRLTLANIGAYGGRRP